MSKQPLIDEFFKSTISRRGLNNIKHNSNVSVTSCSQNRKKRKNLQHSKSTKKRTKSDNSSTDNVVDVQIVYQGISTVNYDKVHRDIKENVQQNISLSQSSISTAASAECTIVYESFNGLSQEDLDDSRLLLQDDNIDESFNRLSQEDLNDSRLLFQDDNVMNESIDLMLKGNDDMSSVNEPRENVLNNNETHLRIAEGEMEHNNEFLEKTPVKKEAIFYESTSPKTETGSSTKKSNYSLKMLSGKSLKKHVTENLFDQFVNMDIAKTVIEHMNLAKQGAIPPNQFNLEEIYSINTFDYCYGQINTKASVHYQLDNVNLPKDLNAKILIGSILTVLSKPFNCGYFDETELDFIYSLLTLPEKCQMLIARMIKRMRGWHCMRAIKYPEISPNLKDVFVLLESHFICSSDIQNENLSVILDLLQADDLRQLCRKMNINCTGEKKNIVIAKLIKLSEKKSLFPGTRSPRSALYDHIFNILDYCVHITGKTWNVIDAIMTLLLPNEDPQSSMSDIFYKLGDIYLGKTKFPNIPENQFPIFPSRSHLITYVNVKSILSKTLNLIEKKDWKEVQSYGNLSIKTLPNVLEAEYLRLENSKLPMHVRKFMPGYLWLKILAKSIDAFKKKKDMTRAVESLNFLIEQKCHMQTYKGKWYCELARIKMHHLKDVDSSALVTIQALNCEYLSQVDKIDLLCRAKQILSRKTGVKPETKMNVSNVLNDYCYQMPTFDTKIVISGSVMPKSARGGKSTWLIESSDQSNGYGTVETVALHYYKKEQNFSNGLHCEGNLPILLFATLFWEELYEKQIPGAFATPYGTAPADLYTKHFYEHRKKDIDTKLSIIESFNADPASFSTWMEARFETYSQYQSIMPGKLLEYSIYMKEIVYCLGVPGVTGICKRMVENFKLWSAGFPDLIVWNYDTRQHKIVEVKGPGDDLSTKQKLWLQYLNELGLKAEVCLVQDKKTS